jgi:hypothetical protein
MDKILPADVPSRQDAVPTGQKQVVTKQLYLEYRQGLKIAFFDKNGTDSLLLDKITR